MSDDDISCRFEEEEAFENDGAKSNTEEWPEYLQRDPDFQAEFDNIVNDPAVPETNAHLHQLYLVTSMNLELAIPRNGYGLEFTKVTKRFREKQATNWAA